MMPTVRTGFAPARITLLLSTFLPSVPAYTRTVHRQGEREGQKEMVTLRSVASLRFQQAYDRASYGRYQVRERLGTCFRPSSQESCECIPFPPRPRAEFVPLPHQARA